MATPRSSTVGPFKVCRDSVRYVRPMWQVAMDVVPVAFGRGKRYFGALDAQQLLEDSDVVIQGRQVLHLQYRVRR
jgi:hypothetical protein